MTSSTKNVIAVLAAATSIVLLYKLAFSGKRYQVRWLIKNNYSTGTPEDLMSFGTDYIKAWYKAARAGQPSFLLNQENYSSKGGKKIT